MFSITEILKACNGKLLQGDPTVTIKSVSTDSRTIARGALFIAVAGEHFDGHTFLRQVSEKGAVAVIVEKPITVVLPKNVCVIRVKNSIRAFGAIAHFHRQRFKIPIIALTGSAGKTTTKEMIVQVLKGRYRVLFNPGTHNNHMGVPATLLKLNASHQVAVIECGTNQPGDIPWLAWIVRPTIVVFTNIGESHLERLKSLTGVFNEKRHLADYLDKKGVIIFNADDAKLRTLKSKVRCISYAIEARADYKAENIRQDKNLIFDFSVKGHRFKLSALGIENVSNALAAIACGQLLKVPFASMAVALKKFQVLSGRQEHVRLRNVLIVNDAYNANPISVKSAVSALDHFADARRIFICADMLELGKNGVKLHETIGKIVAQSGIEVFFTFGDLAQRMSDRAQKAKRAIWAEHFASVDQLNVKLKEIVRAHDVVWIKGSRGMKMERTVEFLKENLKG